MEAIEVQAVNASALCGVCRQRIIVSAEPADEVQKIRVAPHPGRKALEPEQGIAGVSIFADALDILIDPRRVRPIGLERDCAEARFTDQPLRDLCTNAVELVSSMRGLTNQYDSRIAHQPHQRIEIRR